MKAVHLNNYQNYYYILFQKEGFVPSTNIKETSQRPQLGVRDALQVA